MFARPVRRRMHKGRRINRCVRLELEEMESRLTPAASGASGLPLAIAPPPSSGMTAAPNTTPQGVTQPPVPAVITTAPASQLAGTDQAALQDQQSLPSTLLARYGYVGLLQRDPRAAFDLSIVASGGDEGATPSAATEQRAETVLPSAILARQDGANATSNAQDDMTVAEAQADGTATDSAPAETVDAPAETQPPQVP